MAEVNSSKPVNRSKGVEKLKRQSTRVDLTPMVDLGFLLITFFIFTTTMSQPTSLNLIVPKDDINNRLETKESATLTLVPTGDNTVYYYEGSLKGGGSNIGQSSLKNIREVIINKKQRTNADDLFIIIKPATSAVYKTLVDVIDEMTINDIKKYALTDIEGSEEQLLEAKRPK